MMFNKNELQWNIHSELLNQILLEYQYSDREIGGILGLRGGTVIRSIRDFDGYSDAGTYRPNPHSVTAAIRSLLQSDKCDQICFVHSHPREYPLPSYADIRFMRDFLQMNPMFENIGMAIVAGYSLRMYCLLRSLHEENPCLMGSFLGTAPE